MGRPRKDPKDRLTRTITARVSDDQYDWLIEGLDEDEREFSVTVRNAIDSARDFERIRRSKDPHAELQRLLDAYEENEAREAYYDTYGHYPEDK